MVKVAYKWSDEEDTAIIKFYADGLPTSVQTFANNLGVSKDILGSRIKLLREEGSIPEYHFRKTSKYTDDDDAELERLVEKGVSFTNIGLQLGRSKNSVTSRANRLGLKCQSNQGGSADKLSYWYGIDHTRFSTLPPLPDNNHCHFIDDENNYCGEPVVSGKPYCQAHCDICYLKGSKKKDAEEQMLKDLKNNT